MTCENQEIPALRRLRPARLAPEEKFTFLQPGAMASFFEDLGGLKRAVIQPQRIDLDAAPSAKKPRASEASASTAAGSGATVLVHSLVMSGHVGQRHD